MNRVMMVGTVHDGEYATSQHVEDVVVNSCPVLRDVRSKSAVNSVNDFSFLFVEESPVCFSNDCHRFELPIAMEKDAREKGSTQCRYALELRKVV